MDSILSIGRILPENIRSPLIRLKNNGISFYRKTFVNKPFKICESDIDYFYHPYNEAWDNERTIEVPLAVHVLKNFEKKDALEVGNVLSYYIDFHHDIVDKYETGKDVITKDILDYDPGKKYDLIICISTLEHIGWDEQCSVGGTANLNDEKKLLMAINKLGDLLKPEGSLLITVPIGYNPILDKLIIEDKLPYKEMYFMRRVSSHNQWVQIQKNEAVKAKYGEPYPFANVIAIIGKNQGL